MEKESFEKSSEIHMTIVFCVNKHLEPTSNQSFLGTWLTSLLTHNEETSENVIRQVKYPLRRWMSHQKLLGVYVFFVILI